MSLPNKPITRKETYLNAAATGVSDNLPKPVTREEEYLKAIAENGGGGGEGGTTNYNALSNKPKINNETLTGNYNIGFVVSGEKVTFKTGGTN